MYKIRKNYKKKKQKNFFAQYCEKAHLLQYFIYFYFYIKRFEIHYLIYLPSPDNVVTAAMKLKDTCSFEEKL